MKLLLDEMFPAGIAEHLRLRGHDVVAVLERGPELVSKTDDVIFLAAHAEERAIVTENVGHFRDLGASVLGAGSRHHGLIFTTNRAFPRGNPRTPGRMVTALDALLKENASLDSREIWLTPP